VFAIQMGILWEWSHLRLFAFSLVSPSATL